MKHFCFHTEAAREPHLTPSTEHFDVIIIGAGLSGIGAGYRLQTRCPRKRYVILEARAEIGGTWDLFRYPGVRSDSDMFTLGYPFRPWKEVQHIGDGATILKYVRATARANARTSVTGIVPYFRMMSPATRPHWLAAPPSLVPPTMTP